MLVQTLEKNRVDLDPAERLQKGYLIVTEWLQNGCGMVAE